MDLPLRSLLEVNGQLLTTLLKPQALLHRPFSSADAIPASIETRYPDGTTSERQAHTIPQRWYKPKTSFTVVPERKGGANPVHHAERQPTHTLVSLTQQWKGPSIWVLCSPKQVPVILSSALETAGHWEYPIVNATFIAPVPFVLAPIRCDCQTALLRFSVPLGQLDRDGFDKLPCIPLEHLAELSLPLEYRCSNEDGDLCTSRDSMGWSTPL